MPTQSPIDRRRSTEDFGQGQSGYTAGRVEADPSLQQLTRNVSQPRRRDPEESELATDERFTGGGGRPWVLPESDDDDDPEDQSGKGGAPGTEEDQKGA